MSGIFTLAKRVQHPEESTRHCKKYIYFNKHQILNRFMLAYSSA